MKNIVRIYLKKLREFYREMTDYFFDVIFNTFAHKTGIISPRVVWGHFRKNKNKELQKLLHDGLRKMGFKRQLFQTVFKGQTSGIVKKLDKNTGFEEMHVRFYKDGVVDVELEQGRFGLKHWRGKRIFGKEHLIEIIEEMPFSKDMKKSIIDMIEDKDFAAFCKRSLDNPRYRIYKYFTTSLVGTLGLYLAISLTFNLF